MNGFRWLYVVRLHFAFLTACLALSISQGRLPADEPAPAVEAKGDDDTKSEAPSTPANEPAAAHHTGPEEHITNSIDMKLRLISAGEFLMGTDESQADLEKDFGKPYKGFDDNDERPQHAVTLTKPYYIGVYEVGLGDFREFVNDTDYRTEAETSGRGAWGWSAAQRSDVRRADYSWRSWGVNQSETSPVTNVSWRDVHAFLDWLSKKEGKKYRLPTEAEWECACRAGTSTRFYGGYRPLDVFRLANLSDQTQKEYRGVGRVFYNDEPPTGETSIYPEARDGFAFSSPAGRFRPNAFGLYDMLGNAAEWCSDWYAADYYERSPEADPQGPSRGTERVIRGGNFNSLPFDCRCTCRRKAKQEYWSYLVGFRVVRDVD